MLADFVSGLAFYSLGLATLLESRHSSKLRIGSQLPFLAVFGLLLGTQNWLQILIHFNQSGTTNRFLQVATYILLPLSTVFLIGFGVRVLLEVGSLPSWLLLAPPVLFIPLGLLLGYALVNLQSEPSFEISVEVWTRYYLYFPGCLITSLGFLRQRHALPRHTWKHARQLLLVTALAFLLSAFVGGLVVPPANYGLSHFLNSQTLQSLTGLSFEIWQMISALAVTFFVILTLSIFEIERKYELSKVEDMRLKDNVNALIAQSEARQSAESWTEALVGISRQIVEIANVDETLLEIVRTTRKLLHSDIAILGLWDESCSHLIVRCYATRQSSGLHGELEIKDSNLLEPLLSGHSTCIPGDGAIRKVYILCPLLGQRLRAAAITALKLENQLVGGLWVGRLENSPFSSSDLIGLERLADQSVITLTHAHMAARLQSLAVADERSRIAREMHDGLAQILAYLGLEMQTVEYLLKTGEQDKARAVINQARKNIYQAHEDVRENILSLRTTLSGESGIIPALQEYLDEFSIHTGIQMQFDYQEVEDINLSPIAETQMVRIIQEALTNIRKHSHARTVQVHLKSDNRYMSVLIADDGIGFEKQPIRGHLGLEIMQERAESVGGELEIISRPKSGTKVILHLPAMSMQPKLS